MKKIYYIHRLKYSLKYRLKEDDVEKNMKRFIYKVVCFPIRQPHILLQLYTLLTHRHIISQIVLLPLGKMPGSINVAIQKLARTNRNIMPLYIGTATENCSESQGHLREKKRHE